MHKQEKYVLIKISMGYRAVSGQWAGFGADPASSRSWEWSHSSLQDPAGNSPCSSVSRTWFHSFPKLINIPPELPRLCSGQGVSGHTGFAAVIRPEVFAVVSRALGRVVLTHVLGQTPTESCQVQTSGWNAITTGTRISGTTLWISWCSLASKFNLETLQKEAHGFPVSLSWVRVRSLRYCRTQKCHCWEFKIYSSFDFGVGYCLSRVTTDCPLDSQVSNFCIAAGWTLNCWAPREGSSRQSLP